MRCEFHPEALVEYEATIRFYADCQEGLEKRFISAVEHGVSQIGEVPLQWRVVEEDIRRYLTHVFPYAILYTVEPDYVLIIAVAHCHRAPGYWRHRITRNA